MGPGIGSAIFRIGSLPAFSPSVRQMMSHLACGGLAIYGTNALARQPGRPVKAAADNWPPSPCGVDWASSRGPPRRRRRRPSPFDAQDQHDAQHLAATVGELLPALEPVAHLSPMGHELVVVALSAPHQVDQHAAVGIVDPFTPIADHDLVGLAGRHRHVLVEIAKAVISRRADASGIAAAAAAVDALENPAARQHRARPPSSRRARLPGRRRPRSLGFSPD